jgi:oxygen-independent coproporphyrinogen-3 oxidase
VGGAFAQNFRDTPNYYDRLDAGDLPTMRGAWLTEDDVIRATVIERLLCHCVVVKSEVEAIYGIDFDAYFEDALDKLRDAEQDDLVRLLPDRVEVTPLGRLFLRNLAMPFDAYLQRRAPDAKPIFSKTL